MSLILASARNQLLKVEVGINTITMALTLPTVIAGEQSLHFQRVCPLDGLLLLQHAPVEM